MKRREFLSYCVAAGMTISIGGLVSCIRSNISLSQADRDQLSGLLIADAHAHPYQLQLYGSRDYDLTTPTIEIMKQISMVASSFSAVGDMVKYGGRSGMPYSDTLSQLTKVKRIEEKKKVRLILNTSDIQSLIVPNDALGAIMAIEGGDALEGKIRNLDSFYDYGVRMITVLHDHNNEIGFNQRSQSDGPLTPFGIQVIEKMNESGIIVDVAHSKTKTLKSIVEISTAPVIDSHTNPLPDTYEPSKPTRLRTWFEMELIAKTGGVICTWPLAYSQGIHQRTTLKHWAEEILQIKKRLGIEHCGLGTDGGGKLPQRVKGWESVASLPKLIGAMREVGLSQDDIVAYVGGNFLRILNRCLG
jgi:membrane dipeptidase